MDSLKCRLFFWLILKHKDFGKNTNLMVFSQEMLYLNKGWIVLHVNSIFVTHVDNFSVEYISKDIEMVKGNKVTKSNIYRLHNLFID